MRIRFENLRYFNHLKIDQKKQSTSVPSAPRQLKERCFLEGSQVSPVCLSSKYNKCMKMSVERLWFDNDKGTPRYKESHFKKKTLTD